MSRFNHKLEIIVSFLAILELIQQGMITVEQNEIFGEIEFHHFENLA
jgi:chromatin segregation and condensation protein Rec8/ScpA/Scc1 (kleisin family)